MYPYDDIRDQIPKGYKLSPEYSYRVPCGVRIEGPDREEVMTELDAHKKTCKICSRLKDLLPRLTETQIWFIVALACAAGFSASTSKSADYLFTAIRKNMVPED
jgi:hypothetical protein